MGKFRILAAAKYVPDYVVTNDDLSRMVDTDDEWIYTRTGIKQRHINDGGLTSDLCAGVADLLLRQSGVGPDEVDLLIVATATPDKLTPATACYTLKKTGMTNAFAFDINSACAGFICAMSVADKYISSGIYKKVMVIGAETLSKMVDWDDRSTCVLFGDGAGGMLLSAEGAGGLMAESIHADGGRADVITANYFPKEYVRMDGRSVFSFAVNEVPKNIIEVLRVADVDISTVKHFVMHQANSRIIESVVKKLRIESNRFYVNIDRYGNTSAASIPIAVAEMLERGIIEFGTGELIVLSGFGAGLTWGSLLLRI